MASREFQLIRRFFSDCGRRRSDVRLGVGDDAALLCPQPGGDLVVTHDTLVEGVHFFAGTDPQRLGHKCLAVNLSDLAAMGAEPAWVTLALTLPRDDPAWLEGFSAGFCALATDAGVRLVGGDTTRGPLSVSVAAFGWVEPGLALRRDGACIGDLICVSGTLGDAGLALRQLRTGPADELLRMRLEQPTPRLALGRLLRGRSRCAIDISDGLAADLGHILSASGVAARVDLARLPCSAPVRDYLCLGGDWSLPLSAGDDYELCFTLAPEQAGDLAALGDAAGCAVTVVGEIVAGGGAQFLQADGTAYAPPTPGFDHFERQTHERP